MSIAIHNFSRLRALALGPGIIDFCNRTAPDLMRRYDKAASQFDVLQSELEKELNDLRDELHEGSRSEALAAALVMSERMMSLLESTPLTTAQTDSKAAAALAADKMAEKIGGKGEVAVIGHDQTSTTGTGRRDGFVNQIKAKYPKIKVVDVQYGGDQLKSAEIAKTLTQAYPKLKGIFGTNEGLRNDPDGHFLPPPKPRLHELMIKKANKALGIPTYPSRMSMLTKPINSERGSCFYCGQCNRGCSAYADFSSSSVLIKPAVSTGNTTLLPFAMAREVLTDPITGLATGV